LGGFANAAMRRLDAHNMCTAQWTVKQFVALQQSAAGRACFAMRQFLSIS